VSAEAPSLTVEEAREIITASSWTSTGAAGDLLDFRESLNRQRTEMPAEVSDALATVETWASETFCRQMVHTVSGFGMDMPLPVVMEWLDGAKRVWWHRGLLGWLIGMERADGSEVGVNELPSDLTPKSEVAR